MKITVELPEHFRDVVESSAPGVVEGAMIEAFEVMQKLVPLLRNSGVAFVTCVNGELCVGIQKEEPHENN